MIRGDSFEVSSYSQKLRVYDRIVKVDVFFNLTFFISSGSGSVPDAATTPVVTSTSTAPSPTTTDPAAEKCPEPKLLNYPTEKVKFFNPYNRFSLGLGSLESVG